MFINDKNRFASLVSPEEQTNGPPEETLFTRTLNRRRTASSVSLTVEWIAHQQGISLLEACEQFLNEDGMGDQEFAGLLTPALKEKLRLEAREQNYIRDDDLDNQRPLDEWFS